MKLHNTVRGLATALLCCGLVAAQDSKPDTKSDSKAEQSSKDEKKDEDRFTVVRGADVYTGTGALIRRGVVVIKNKQIEAVGNDVEIPEDATIIDATGKVVSPGFIAVQAGGFGQPRAFGADEVADGLNPFDPSIKLGLAVGITSYGVMMSGGRDTPKGKSAVLKLTPGDLEGMVCATNRTVQMRMPLDRKQWRGLRELVKKAREHLEKVEEAKNKKPDDKAKSEKAKPASGSGSERRRPSRSSRRSSSGKSSGPKPPRGTEEILAVMAGEKRLWIDLGNRSSGWFGGGASDDHDKIRQAMQVAELFGQGVVLVRPVTAWVRPEEIARTGSMAILSPRSRVQADDGKPDTTGSNLASAAILAEAGVPVATITPSSSLGLNGILGQDLGTLNLSAAFAVRGGLNNRKALRAITLDAARTLGVESKIGSLEAGKDADLLILDGDPLHYSTLVETAIVNGSIVYERHKEPFYSHITR